jgi:hypothetical protein
MACMQQVCMGKRHVRWERTRFHQRRDEENLGMTHKILSLSVLAAACLAVSVKAADEGGTVTGIVASKGDTWLGVKAEGQEDPSLYMPYWKGTGFDNEMLATIKTVAVGSKVKLVWKSDEHPRIVSLEMLAAPEKPVVAEKRERHQPEGLGEKERMPDKERMGDKERMAEKERMMAEREKERMAEKEKRGHKGEKGSLTGMVVSKGEVAKSEGVRSEAYIEVKIDANTPPEKYYPRYIPGEEGGSDREMMRVFQKLKVGEWIKMDWVQDERRRAVKIERAPQQ